MMTGARMVRRTGSLALAVAAGLAMAAATAGSAWATAKPKPVVDITEEGVLVKDGATVEAGWVAEIKVEESVGASEPAWYYGCELTGQMTLTRNASSSKDLAQGSIATPDAQCGEFAVEAEEGESPAALRAGARAHRRAPMRAHMAVVSPEEPKLVGGELTGEEFAIKAQGEGYQGTVILSKALRFEVEEPYASGKVKCFYESQTKLSGTWPASEYPGTADIAASVPMKLGKGSAKKGCEKKAESYVEAWLGPEFEELEAEVVEMTEAGGSAPPDFKICGKAAKVGAVYKGKYLNKTCSVNASEEEVEKGGKKNDYEGDPISTAKKKPLAFTGENEATPISEIVDPLDEPAKDEGATECTREVVNGEVISATEETWHTVYTGCKADGTACATVGAATGEIRTQTLVGTLVFLNSAKTVVGIRVKPKVGKLLAQYECVSGAVKVEETGEVLERRDGDVGMASADWEDIAEKGSNGLQKYLYEEEKETSADGKGFFVWGYGFEGCVKEQLEEGRTLGEAEGICFGKLGPFPGYPNSPISIVSILTGSENETAPATQNSITKDASKEKALFVEA